MTMGDSGFWTGYKAALDDVERSILKVKSGPVDLGLTMSRIARIRADFNLAARDDTGRLEISEELEGPSVSDQALETLTSRGMSEADAREMLAFAARRGREMAEIDTDEEEDEELDETDDA